MRFILHKTEAHSRARLGTLHTAHGDIETPVFMPVGTRGSVKTLTQQHLVDSDVRIMLCNTYHLLLRPGLPVIEKAGGLHAFMGWDRALVTDSGGYQIFSLSKLNKVGELGVEFQSHIDGSRFFVGPADNMRAQRALGSDIVMALDESVPYPCSRENAEKALMRTLGWAGACRQYPLRPYQSLFGIIQGGVYSDLRVQAAQTLRAMDFDGYAIGGLSVGLPADRIIEIMEAVIPYLPENKPRYAMGVGTPRNIIEAVMRGVDLFDCVMPTRNARNGTAFTWGGKVHIKAGRYADDFSPLDPELDCFTNHFSKAYIRHLLNVGEIAGLELVSLQNVAFYMDFMAKLRQAIRDDTLPAFYQRICAIYTSI